MIKMAKKFVVHQRGRDLWNEPKSYLRLVNNQLNKNLDHYFHPSKIKVKELTGTDGDAKLMSESSLSTPLSTGTKK